VLHIFQQEAAYYVLPPDYYEYCHPEGTGKGIPPFFSSWICGGMSSDIRQISRIAFQKFPRRAVSVLPTGVKRIPFSNLTVIDTVESVAALGLVADKRPNPKQRRKLQSKM
jgi:hypothetical protein